MLIARGIRTLAFSDSKTYRTGNASLPPSPDHLSTGHAIKTGESAYGLPSVAGSQGTPKEKASEVTSRRLLPDHWLTLADRRGDRTKSEKFLYRDVTANDVSLSRIRSRGKRFLFIVLIFFERI